MHYFTRKALSSHFREFFWFSRTQFIFMWKVLRCTEKLLIFTDFILIFTECTKSVYKMSTFKSLVLFPGEDSVSLFPYLWMIQHYNMYVIFLDSLVWTLILFFYFACMPPRIFDVRYHISIFSIHYDDTRTSIHSKLIIKVSKYGNSCFLFFHVDYIGLMKHYNFCKSHIKQNWNLYTFINFVKILHILFIYRYWLLLLIKL